VPAITVNLDFFPHFAHFCPENAVENTERLTLIFDQTADRKGEWKGREKKSTRTRTENNDFVMRMK
jgi:hypothetical protein